MHVCVDIIDMMLTLKVELSMVSEWLAANKLTLNIAKTKYVIFGKPRQLVNLPDYNLTIDDQHIERVQYMKYLGVSLDASLNFNQHISLIHNKAVNKLGILRRSRDFLDRKTSLTLYQSLILPQLTYCDLVYETTNKSNTDKLQKVQNSALWCTLRCDKCTSVKKMHNDLKILTLDQRRNLNRAVQCYKEFTNNTSGLHYMFQRANNTRTTRRGNSKNVVVPRVDTEVGRKSFSFREPVFWNGLNANLKTKKIRIFSNLRI